MSDEYPCKFEGCSKVLKSRAGIYKHELKCEHSMGVSEETEMSEESPSSPESHTTDVEEPDSSTPTFQNYSYKVEDLESDIPVPSPLKFITGGKKSSGKKKNQQELAIMSKTNEAMLSLGYKSVDGLASRYRVAITGDEEMTITHSESDYKWISGMTNAYLMEKGFDINAYLGTGKAAIICNSWWFGSIGATLHKDAKKLDKSLGLLRKPLGGIKKLLSYIPIIGKRFRQEKPVELFTNTKEEVE